MIRRRPIKMQRTMVYFEVIDVAWLGVVIGMETTLRSNGLL